MKSLHVDNVANVAYANCKLLNQRPEHRATLCFHNLEHLMSQPEWDDLELNADDFPDEFQFSHNKADLKAHHLPDWVHRDNLFTYNHPATKLIANLLPTKVKDVIRPFYFFCWRILHRISRISPLRSQSEKNISFLEERCRSLSELSASFGENWYLGSQHFSHFYRQVQWLEKYLKDHDMVFSYSLSPIISMIMGNHPYVGVEIGTMRDIPFDGTIVGKLLALAYRLSPHVIITNPDVRKQAEKLGLTRFSFCPHPVDEDRYKPADKEEVGKLRDLLLPGRTYDYVMFCPARQNWEVKGNDRYFHAFAMLRKTGINGIMIVPGWGQEVSRSKGLCDQLGISAHVQWLKPLPESMMIRYFQMSDMVLDQFILGVFGLITPKAMSCGTPVITSYRHDIQDWCFPVKPPVLAASTKDEIYHQLKFHYENPHARYQAGRESREWILKYHHKKAVVDSLVRARDLAVEYFKRNSNQSQ